jgi:hypothetical protein
VCREESAGVKREFGGRSKRREKKLRNEGIVEKHDNDKISP